MLCLVERREFLTGCFQVSCLYSEVGGLRIEEEAKEVLLWKFLLFTHDVMRYVGKCG